MRYTRFPLALGLSLAPTLALAQQQPAADPLEQVRQQQLLRAQDSTAGAYDAVDSLHLDLDALSSYPLERPEVFDPQQVRNYLYDVRERLLTRLAQLNEERAEALADLPQTRSVLRIYDVQDVAVAPSDHPAPRLGLDEGIMRSATAAGGVLSFDEETPESSSCLEPDALIDQLDEELGDDVSGDTCLEYNQGRLLVRASPALQDRVAAFLAGLRQQRGGALELDVRAYALPAATLAALRPGLADGLDADEERRLEAGARLLGRERVLARDGQRVSLKRMHTRAYLGDVEVNQTGVIPVVNPVIRSLNTGLCVELKTLVDRAGQRALIETQGWLAEALQLSEVEVCGSKLVLPTVRLAGVNGLTSVPLGRGALVGGTCVCGADDEALNVVLYVRPTLKRTSPQQGGAQ